MLDWISRVTPGKAHQTAPGFQPEGAGPQATADSEHMHACAQPNEARQLPRGLPAAVVGLVKRRQVVPRRSGRILARLMPRGEYLRTQLRVAMVLVDGLGVVRQRSSSLVIWPPWWNSASGRLLACREAASSLLSHAEHDFLLAEFRS
jgi:hypothetical protein